MRMSWSEVRFLVDRGTGLFHRGMTSLRTRGLASTWRRVLHQLRPVPAAQRPLLYAPPPAPFAPFAVAHGATPRASIVIPVFNHVEHTIACLRALAAHPPAAAIEVIVVDDGSSDATPTLLAQVAGLRYHRRAANGGFIAACNDGAALARGEFVVLLNNDTVPQPGWLDALLATFDENPDAGLVGAQLLYPDGRLQESGGVVFNDGSAANLGRFDAPDDPRFAHLRDVDYVSGAAIAVPRTLFVELGGFDTRYAPAYYEDTDLAFAIRARGLRTLVQPAARVVHDEGTSAGTDTRAGPKAYQVRNRAVFADKWSAVLASHAAPGTDLPGALAQGGGRRVLVIDAEAPRPDRDSASLRLHHLLALLVEEGARVTFVPADGSHAGEATRALQRIGVEAWYAPYLASLPAWLREHASRFDTIVVSRHHLLRGLLPLLRRHAPQARVVFDSVDLHYLRERRAAEVSGDPAAQRAAGRTRAAELDVIARSDATLVVSAAERDLLARDAPGARVEVLSNLHRVHGPGRAFGERRDVVFVGGFRHPPNVDAVRWFVAQVWPDVRARLPGVVFHCIGGDVPPEIAALASVPGVRVHGHVPDLAPYMDGARVAVAPLRFGAGVKGKVNLSMAHGQPVVATPCAVEGMHLRDGIDVVVADGAAEFAEAVAALYVDEPRWNTLAANGLRNVERHFSFDAARDVVRRVLLDRTGS